MFRARYVRDASENRGPLLSRSKCEVSVVKTRGYNALNFLTLTLTPNPNPAQAEPAPTASGGARPSHVHGSPTAAGGSGHGVLGNGLFASAPADRRNLRQVSVAGRSKLQRSQPCSARP